MSSRIKVLTSSYLLPKYFKFSYMLVVLLAFIQPQKKLIKDENSARFFLFVTFFKHIVAPNLLVL